MKILNLYAGIGGNRKLWGDSHEITAVELNPEIAKIYSDFFPNDKMIVADAHEYLLKHFKEYDFIWSSPPCSTHSRARFWGAGNDRIKPKYADMVLYQEILFLQHFFKGLYCVENVIPYYTVLIPAREINRHLFWSNFIITDIELPHDNVNRGTAKSWSKLKGFDLSGYKIKNRKDQIYRNIMNPELGLHIFNAAQGIYLHTKDVNQMSFIDG